MLTSTLLIFAARLKPLGWKWGMKNDFIFHIEVVLQEIGYLTEDFEIDESFEERAAFPLNLHSGDEFCFENRYYTCLEIKWEGEVAKILAKHIDNGVRNIECDASEIS
jgi:hypothetical protein